LKIQRYGDWFTLDHYHYDVFEINMMEKHKEKTKVFFSLDKQGEISSLHLPIEPAIGDTVFKRMSLALSEASLTTLVGNYSFPVEGQDVVVSLKDGELELAITGQLGKKLSAVSQTSERLRFKFAKDENTIVDFTENSKGGYDLLMKSPDAAYECFSQ
jgi:hypothetical protein